MAMFLIDRVTVAVRWTLSWASETTFSYSRTLGLTITLRWGPKGRSTATNGALLWSNHSTPSDWMTSRRPRTLKTSSVSIAPAPPETTIRLGWRFLTNWIVAR